MQFPIEMPVRQIMSGVGILTSEDAPQHLQLFLEQSDEAMKNVRAMIASGQLQPEHGPEFQQLLVDVCARVLCHPIVESNLYLMRFAQGVTEAQARHECQQFSVFALNFDVAQAKLVANAPTEESYEERLNVLLNEKGIPYKDGFEGDLTGRWRSETVHFTWLRNMAKGLGLEFGDIGKQWLGKPGTQEFVRATFEYYGSPNQNTASGAAFAIENWAAAYLWKPWIAGMEVLNATREKKVDLGYLKYHDLEEQHHSQATIDELLENFVEPWFDRGEFLAGAEAMLTDGVEAYYRSQLETAPEKDDSWPKSAVEPRRFDPASLPAVRQTSVTA
jgi:hypothetical protein